VRASTQKNGRAVPTRSAQIRISGKNLGALALPGACERCLWLKTRMGHRLPYGGMFPGIFSTFDKIQKELVHGHFDERRRPPAWLEQIGPLTGYQEPPHYSKFCFVDPGHNILLTGAPDAILRPRDEGLIICDYKTARYTGTQDELHPMYEVQLNAYALIAKRLGMGRIAGLYLIYLEPCTPADGRCSRWIRPNGFTLPFSARVLRVEQRPETIPPLLSRVRELHDAPAPPPARSGCKDCMLLERVMTLMSSQQP